MLYRSGGTHDDLAERQITDPGTDDSGVWQSGR